MAQNSNITKELEQKVNRFIRITLKDMAEELTSEFGRNFERGAFFNERWARRKYNDDATRGLLVQTGKLRQSIRADPTDHSVIFSSDLPYAAIHNEGGTITVTRRMKAYFWYRYRLLTDNYRRTPTSEAEFCKRMALKKVGSKITIPKRRFIGMHPEVERIIREIVEANSKKIF